MIYTSDVNIQKEASHNESSSSLVSSCVSRHSANMRGGDIGWSRRRRVVCVPHDLQPEKKVGDAVWSETTLQTSASYPTAHNWEPFFTWTPYKSALKAVISLETLHVICWKRDWCLLALQERGPQPPVADTTVSCDIWSMLHPLSTLCSPTNTDKVEMVEICQ